MGFVFIMISFSLGLLSFFLDSYKLKIFIFLFSISLIVFYYMVPTEIQSFLDIHFQNLDFRRIK